MRYPQGGGLTPERQAFRERIRLQGAERFAAGASAAEVAKDFKTLIGRRFHESMTLSAIAQMLHRHGFSHQVPARRAVERDEEAVAGWVKETLTASRRQRQ